MSMNDPSLLTCPSCGERVAPSPDAGPAPAHCPTCGPRPDNLRTRRSADDVLREVWANLCAVHRWEQLAGCVILLSTTFIPVMALWGAGRIKPDEPLLPLFAAIATIGGAIGMPL